MEVLSRGQEYSPFLWSLDPPRTVALMTKIRPDSVLVTSQILQAAGLTLNARDLARCLGVCTATIYEMAKRGQLEDMGIRVLRAGRSMRFPTADARRALGVDEEGAGHVGRP